LCLMPYKFTLHFLATVALRVWPWPSMTAPYKNPMRLAEALMLQAQRCGIVRGAKP
jgi:hypothetical protein